MQIKAISISDRKGIRKKNIEKAELIVNSGIKDDAHAGRWHRQVSLLAEESIESMRDKGLDVVAGNFAENITTEGLDLTKLAVGTHISLGETELIISQLGKICHDRCAIYHQAGDCVMPREGIFGVVITAGTIRVGDKIEILGQQSPSAAIIGSKQAEKQHGSALHSHVQELFNPAFIRFDTLSEKEGGTVQAILKDLTETQRTSNIVIYDPDGNLGLMLPAADSNKPGYIQHQSRVYCVRTIDELNELKQLM